MDKVARGWTVRKWVILPELTQVAVSFMLKRVNTEDKGQEWGGQRQLSRCVLPSADPNVSPSKHITGGSLSLRPAWSTKQAPGQSGLHFKTLSITIIMMIIIIIIIYFLKTSRPGVVLHIWNPSPWEAEAGGPWI